MSWRLVLAVLACLAAAGCAADNGRKSSDDGRFGGFYGGLSGGGTLP